MFPGRVPFIVGLLWVIFTAVPCRAAAASEAAVQFGQDDDITVLTLTRLALAHPAAEVRSEPLPTPA
jgi:hypothetical protein